MHRTFSTYVVCTLMLVVAVLGGLVWARQTSAPATSPATAISEEGVLAPTTITEARTYWREQIRQKGAGDAYTAFKRAYADLSAGPQHTLAHVFGELLYDEEGIEGLAVCDSTFAFGCYHSFFGRAIPAEGLGALPRFDEVCKTVPGTRHLPCQHGIGHGLLVYVGHENVREALELCTRITWQKTGGCTSGVFMEYNFRTMESFGGEEARELDEDPYQPCTRLPDRFKHSCYFEQVQWWGRVFEHNYERVGEMCANIPKTDSQYRPDCYHGVGNYAAAFADSDVSATIEICRRMPSMAATAHCSEGATWLLGAVEDGAGDVSRLCSHLPADFAQECRRQMPSQL